MSGLSFDRDSDLSLDVAGFEILIRGGGLSKRVGLRESRQDLSAFRHIAENAEILGVKADAEADELLVRKLRAERGCERGDQIDQSLLAHSGAAHPGQDT